MLQKFARADVIGIKSSGAQIRQASLDKFADYSDYRTDDGYLYVRVRAISSRVNKNHDGWPSEELQKAYRTFVGKPIFVDHHNHDPKKARGVIVDAKLHVEDMQKASSLDPYYANAPAEHTPPTWIELLLEVDAKKFPRLAKAIVGGDIDGVSMGANVERSKCSHCANWARHPDEYCSHVVSKGAYHDYRDPKTGQKVSKRSYEDCYDIGFFEISFVFDPADETALVHEIKQKVATAVHAEAGEYQCPKCPSTATLKNDNGSYKCGQCGALYTQAYFNELKGVSEKESAATDSPSLVQDFGRNALIEARREYNQAMHEGADREAAVRAALVALKGLGMGKDEAVTSLQEALATPAQMIAAMNPQMHTEWTQALDAMEAQLAGSPEDPALLQRIQRLKQQLQTQNPNGHLQPQQPQQPFAPLTAKVANSVYADRRNPPPQDDMTTAPDRVDTLRQEQLCPICGSDMEDGVCEVCNYEEPPEGFDNPDLQKAQEVDQQIADQAEQQAANENPDPMAPGASAPAPAPAPAAGGMPLSNVSYTSNTEGVVGNLVLYSNGTYAFVTTSGSGPSNVTDEGQRTANGNNASGGKINTSEKPLLPASRQTSDKPLGAQVIKDYSAPVESKTRGEIMSETQKVADGASAAGGAATAPDNRVDATGVGGVSGDPLKGTEHQNVEKEVNVTAPHTDTWGPGEGDSLGQGDPVTNTPFPNKDSYASTQHEGGPAFPDHEPKKVNLLAPISDEVGDPTKTWSGTEGQADPVDGEEGVGAPDFGKNLSEVKAAAVAEAKRHTLAAFKLAETEVALGITDADKKFDRVAELEGESIESLEARLDTLARAKTAGFGRPAPKKTSAVNRTLPSLSRVASAAESAQTDIPGVADAGLFS